MRLTCDGLGHWLSPHPLAQGTFATAALEHGCRGAGMGSRKALLLAGDRDY